MYVYVGTYDEILAKITICFVVDSHGVPFAIPSTTLTVHDN